MLRPLPERLKEAIVSGHSLVSQRTRLEAASILLEWTVFILGR